MKFFNKSYSVIFGMSLWTKRNNTLQEVVIVMDMNALLGVFGNGVNMSIFTNNTATA